MSKPATPTAARLHAQFTDRSVKSIAAAQQVLCELNTATDSAELMPVFQLRQLTAKYASLCEEAGVYNRCAKITGPAFMSGCTDEEIIGYLRSYCFDLLAQGADDTWSGRGNDDKRSDFDTVRHAVKQVRNMLDHGC